MTSDAKAMQLHLIPGNDGCRFASRQKAAAVIVDALRASATAAALLEHGSKKLMVTGTVEDAFSLKAALPDALLYGERGGLPPEGFDYGNSPQEAINGRSRHIIFTTTSGAGRLIAAWGALPLLMGSTVNAASVVQYLLAAAVPEVALVPAGLMDDPSFNAQEDWTAATYIAMMLCEACAGHRTVVWGRGHEEFLEYQERIRVEGVASLFATAPHAEKLRAVAKEGDVQFCAQTNIYDAVPVACEKIGACLTVRNGYGQDGKTGVSDG